MTRLPFGRARHLFRDRRKSPYANLEWRIEKLARFGARRVGRGVPPSRLEKVGRTLRVSRDGSPRRRVQGVRPPGEISMRGYVNTENQKNTSCGIFRLGRKPLPRRLVTSFLSALCSGSMPGCLLRSVFGLPLSSRTLSPNLTTQSPGRGVGCLRNGFRASGGVPVKLLSAHVPLMLPLLIRRRQPLRRRCHRRMPCRT